MEYELYHHGILGMKWGVRRFQNADGSLTPAGRKRLQKNEERVRKAGREYEKAGFLGRAKAKEKYDKALDKYTKFANKLEYAKMTDAELFDASKKFVSDNFKATLSSQAIKDGQASLTEKIKLLSSAVALANDTTKLIGNVKDVFELSKESKEKRQMDLRRLKLDERKQSLEERKEDSSKLQKLIDKKKVELDESRENRYWEAFRKSVDRYEKESKKDSNQDKGPSYKEFLGDEEKDEIKKKTK